MDAKELYQMIKPQLDLLNPTQKASFYKLVTSQKPKKITGQHRKVRPLSKTKEYLKSFRLKEMERERKNTTGL